MLDDSDGTVIKVSYGPAVRMIVIAAFLFFSALAAAACLQGYSVYTVGFALLFVVMDAMLVPFVFFANIRFSEAWEYFVFTFCHRQYRIDYSDCCSCEEEGLQTVIRLSPRCAHRFRGFTIRRIVLDRFMTNRDAFIHTLHSKHVQTGCDKVCGTVTVKTRTDVTAALLFWVTGISLLYIYIRLEGSRDIYEANKALVNTVFGVMIGLPFILAICFLSRKITFRPGSNGIVYHSFGLKKSIPLSQITDIKRTPSTDTLCVYCLNGKGKKCLRIHCPNSQTRSLFRAWNSAGLH